MPVTLAQAAQNAQTDLDVAIISEFQTNPLMNLLTFDDVVNPAGGGATLTYGYRRQITAATAAFRAINSEYTPGEVTTEQKFVDLKVGGGSYQLDRILAKIGPAATGEVAFQTGEKITAAKALFGDATINGDSSTNPSSFDGLSKALAGTSTEDVTVRDISGTHDEAWAWEVLEHVDELLSLLDGEAGALIGNKKLLNLIKSAARRTSQYTREPGPRDTYVERYGPAVLIDAGKKAGSSADVVPVNATDPDAGGPLVAGSTALYAVRFGLDGFHGVSTAGGELVSNYPPDFTTPGAVKTGEVEFGPAAVVLKKTKAAAVARNFKIQ